MDTVLKIFFALGSGAVALFSSFLIGLLLGMLVWSRIRKRIPLEFRPVCDQIKWLEKELDRMDGIVAKLWLLEGLFLDERTPSRLAINYDSEESAVEPVHDLTKRIIGAKQRLISLRGDIDYVIAYLPKKPPSLGITGNRSGRARTIAPDPLALSGTVDPGRDTSDLTAGPVSGISRSRAGVVWDSDFRVGVTRQGPRLGRAQITEIIALYNRALDDPLARERLREEYQPIRLGTVNAVERRQNPTIKAEFKETTDGDFFAFPIPGKNEYAVLPRLGLTIEAVSYTAGALGEVFNRTQGYDPKLFYSRYGVKQEAIFRREGDCWELREPGELDLGSGD